MGQLLKTLLKKPYMLLYCVLLSAAVFISANELQRLQTELLLKRIELSGINYDAFRTMQLDRNTLNKAKNRMNHLLKRHPELMQYPYMDSIGYLTFSMLANDFNGLNSSIVKESTFIRGMAKVAGTDSFAELYNYYKATLTDLLYFPVPKLLEGDADVTFEDTWYFLRNYGGKRRHEGTDLMASNNVPGYFPVISITEGIVENVGWLEKGGWRIGVRSPSGGYFYYAHLDSYAPELKTGDRVMAGQLLGFMGDSGYGSEGTTGKFDVHLHLGIYVPSSKVEMSINPYWILRLLEKNRTQYSYQQQDELASQFTCHE